MEKIKEALREHFADWLTSPSPWELLVGSLGSALLNQLAFTTVLKGWWQSLPADQRSQIYILGFCVALTLVVALWVWYKRRQHRKEWPVVLTASTKTVGEVFLEVCNQADGDELKVIVSWMGALDFGLTTPFSLPWKDGDPEYRYLASGEAQKVRLLEYTYQGDPLDQRGKPRVDLHLNTAVSRSGHETVWLSNLFSQSEDEVLSESIFRVAVIGRESGFRRDFRVLVKFHAALEEDEAIYVTVDVPDGHYAETPPSSSLLFSKKHDYNQIKK